jgi:hypothetical protein
MIYHSFEKLEAFFYYKDLLQKAYKYIRRQSTKRFAILEHVISVGPIKNNSLNICLDLKGSLNS